MSGFDVTYWRKNYSKPSEMDGCGNAKDHALYLKYCFKLTDQSVESVIDLGFGLGMMFKAVLQALGPKRAFGIEPSAHAFEQVQNRWRLHPPTMSYKLVQQDLVTWSQAQDAKARVFDLGLCTSVFQYLTDAEVAAVVPAIARQCRYLYFSVPTDLELERLRDEVDFVDEYALARSPEFYWQQLSPYFTCVSGRLLESKLHFSAKNTPFADLLFRF